MAQLLFWLQKYNVAWYFQTNNRPESFHGCLSKFELNIFLIKLFHVKAIVFKENYQSLTEKYNQTPLKCTRQRLSDTLE